MTDRTWTIQISKEIYERAQQVAKESHRSIESVVVEGFSLLHGPLPIEVDLAEFESLTDDELWYIVWLRLPFSVETRLETLSDLGDEGKLTDAEREELGQLVRRVDRFVLLRSAALVTLQERGHDVMGRLKRAM